jgi:hypothetical protein
LLLMEENIGRMVLYVNKILSLICEVWCRWRSNRTTTGEKVG